MDFSQIMLIEINEDIIDAAIEKKDYEKNDALDLLLMMAYCCRHGKHIVRVPCLRTNKPKMKSLIGLIGLSNARTLNSLNDKVSGAKSLFDNLSVKAIISYNNPIKTTDNESCRIIWINPLEHTSFEPWIETHVLTENLIDSEFFSYIIRYFLKIKNLRDAKCNFYPLMGGGDTMRKVLENEILISRHFCLTLADSDKLYPNDVIGSTANKVKELMVQNPFNCGFYVMSNVREVENLIPRKIVEKLCVGKDFSIFDKDPSFFDMKLGLCLVDLYRDEVCNYWRNLFQDPNLFQERDYIKARYNEKKQYDVEIKGKAALLSGFGSDILALALNKSNKQKQRLDSKNDLYSITRKDLNTFQQREWEAIGKEMFSWTCSLKVQI